MILISFSEELTKAIILLNHAHYRHHHLLKSNKNPRILKIPATQSRREALMQPSLIASTLLTEISNKPRTQNFRISHSERLTHRYPQKCHPLARNSTDSCFQGIGTTIPYHRPSQSYCLPKARTT